MTKDPSIVTITCFCCKNSRPKKDCVALQLLDHLKRTTTNFEKSNITFIYQNITTIHNDCLDIDTLSNSPSTWARKSLIYCFDLEDIPDLSLLENNTACHNFSSCQLQNLPYLLLSSTSTCLSNNQIRNGQLLSKTFLPNGRYLNIDLDSKLDIFDAYFATVSLITEAANQSKLSNKRSNSWSSTAKRVSLYRSNSESIHNNKCVYPKKRLPDHCSIRSPSVGNSVDTSGPKAEAKKPSTYKKNKWSCSSLLHEKSISTSASPQKKVKGCPVMAKIASQSLYSLTLATDTPRQKQKCFITDPGILEAEMDLQLFKTVDLFDDERQSRISMPPLPTKKVISLSTTFDSINASLKSLRGKPKIFIS
eukprot:Awhi_evm1s8911